MQKVQVHMPIHPHPFFAKYSRESRDCPIQNLTFLNNFNEILPKCFNGEFGQVEIVDFTIIMKFLHEFVYYTAQTLK